MSPTSPPASATILWCDRRHSPAENMRRDAALLGWIDERARTGQATPAILRLFGFQPHGITLGRAQVAESVLDLERCAFERIPWSVRPTGGRAIFHAEEWTYAMVAPLDHPHWGGTLAEACRRITTWITTSLRHLGVPAVTTGMTSNRAVEGEPLDARGACFASSVRHEILVEGRKLAGSAQRRTAHALLQQGSILLGPGHLRLVDYLLSSASQRATLRSDLLRASCDAGRWLGAHRSLARWADAMITTAPGETWHEDRELLTLIEEPLYTSAIVNRDEPFL